MQKLEVLAIAAHPDDIELSCGGTIALQVALGNKVGIIDLTEGEMGTRGSRELRREEAAAAKEALGIAVRDNMKFKDAFFKNDHEHQLKLIQKIREYQPEIVITNAPEDRHTDHPRASQLVTEACFLSGLAKISTRFDGKDQEAWRPKAVYYFIQSNLLMPDFIVDVSDHWENKMNSIKAYKSQFFDPKSEEPKTYISSPQFMKMIEARGIEFGHLIGAKYGEGFLKQRIPGVKDLKHLL
ncbi:MAG: bacillithiol biosynthesis deacetylase BshB1 [Candidatus Cyclobacteriaceae bacterium M2_1C_046]